MDCDIKIFYNYTLDTEPDYNVEFEKLLFRVGELGLDVIYKLSNEI